MAPIAIVPAEPAIAAATVAGEGSASSAGTAASGAGSGAGGAGLGLGGGGGRTGALLLAGRLDRRDYRAIAGGGLAHGSALYLLLVGPSGRIERCRVVRGSGVERVDRSICAFLTDRLLFRPAMEADGSPIYQDVEYVARWGRR